MTAEKRALQRLRTTLTTAGHGSLSVDDVVPLLADCWHLFDGCTATRMHAGKLDRTEKVIWAPPVLRVVVERHGAPQLGSIYAEVQEWQVDVEAMTATPVEISRRQIGRRAPKIDVRPLAARVVSKISTREDDPGLDWLDSKRTRVRVRIGRIVPDGGPKQTVKGRRDRFFDALDRLLPSEWKCAGSNAYEFEAGD